MNLSKRDMIAKQAKNFVHHEDITAVLDTVLTAVRAHPWTTLPPDRFAADLATASTYLNYAHPFREGNGRAQKLLLAHIAEQTPYTLDYDRVSNVQWVRAHTVALPETPYQVPDTAGLTRTIERITVPRPGTTLPTPTGTGIGRLAAGNPHPRHHRPGRPPAARHRPGPHPRHGHRRGSGHGSGSGGGPAREPPPAPGRQLPRPARTAPGHPPGPPRPGRRCQDLVPRPGAYRHLFGTLKTRASKKHPEVVPCVPAAGRGSQSADAFPMVHAHRPRPTTGRGRVLFSSGRQKQRGMLPRETPVAVTFP